MGSFRTNSDNGGGEMFINLGGMSLYMNIEKIIFHPLKPMEGNGLNLLEC